MGWYWCAQLCCLIVSTRWRSISTRAEVEAPALDASIKLDQTHTCNLFISQWIPRRCFSHSQKLHNFTSVAICWSIRFIKKPQTKTLCLSSSSMCCTSKSFRHKSLQFLTKKQKLVKKQLFEWINKVVISILPFWFGLVMYLYVIIISP